MDVSIIITIHKSSKYTKYAINSALRQTFQGKYEVILAIDNNENLLKLYSEGKNYTIAMHRGKIGFSSNFNNAAKQAKGRFLKVLAYDDILMPDCIQFLFNKIKKGYDIVHANAYSFTDKKQDKYIPKIKSPSIETLLERNYIHGGTIMFNRETFVKLGMYDVSLLYCEEFELYLRMLSRSAKFSYVDAYVYKYRIHDNQKSSRKQQPVVAKQIKRLYK